MRSENKFNIDETSLKEGSDYLITADIIGKTRTLPPDLGAYTNHFPRIFSNKTIEYK
jgi:hypothetical protein